MGLLLETLGVVVVSAAGVAAGHIISRRTDRWWVVGYFVALGLICAMAVSRFGGRFGFAGPLLWMTAGRVKFVILSVAVTVGLTTPLRRLPRRLEKVLVCIVMVVVVGWFCVVPFVMPALIRGRLANLETKVDSSGVCLQSTDYTCGPAAAVTALRRLGFEAEEGQLAILSHTSPMTGTLPGCLCEAMEKLYGRQGLKCKYRVFESVEELKAAGLTLAVVRDAFLRDHCVTVLEVSDEEVVVGDPAVGRCRMEREQFERLWRFCGIVLGQGQAKN